MGEITYNKIECGYCPSTGLFQSIFGNMKLLPIEVGTSLILFTLDHKVAHYILFFRHLKEVKCKGTLLFLSQQTRTE